MKSLFKYVCFITAFGFIVSVEAMEKPKQREESAVRSLQELSAEAVLSVLLSFIEQEINNNVIYDSVLADLPAFVSLYVPNKVSSFEPIWQQLFVNLLHSSIIPAKDKIVLIKNHMQKTHVVGKNTREVIDLESFHDFELGLQHDILDYLINQFENENYNEALELKSFIIKKFDLGGKEGYLPTELYLAIVNRWLNTDTVFSFDKKYSFIKSLVLSKERLGLSDAQVEQFLHDNATFIRDYLLQKVDANSSSIVVVHQLANGVKEIAELMHLDEHKKRILLANIFSALMLSDRFTVRQKQEIVDEILKSFGGALIFHQPKSILKIIKLYSSDNDTAKIGVNSLIQTELGSSTLLHLAMIKINVNPLFAKTLLQLSANVNAIDYCGRTPIYNALSLGSRDGVKLLLSKGARVDIKDQSNKTPLHTFFDCLSFVPMMEDPIQDIVKELLKHPVQLNQHDNNGNTPLALWRNLTGLSPEFKKNIEDVLIQHGAI